MGLNDTKPFLNDFAVDVEKRSVDGEGTETVEQARAIVSQPTRDIAFGGVVVVSTDYTLDYATTDLNLKERDKISVLGGPNAGRYQVREAGGGSDDGLFSQVKLTKIL